MSLYLRSAKHMHNTFYKYGYHFGICTTIYMNFRIRELYDDERCLYYRLKNMFQKKNSDDTSSWLGYYRYLSKDKKHFEHRQTILCLAHAMYEAGDL